MPLTKRQFELGIDEESEALMREIYGLLAANHGLAYSIRELRESVIGSPLPVSRSSKFKRAVEALVGIGAVDLRKVAKTDYYAFLQEFDTGTWYSAKHTPTSPYS